MERRTFWKALAGLPVGLGLARRAAAEPVGSMKQVEEVQKNWKLLLAEGAAVPSPDRKAHV